jgi:hypothetical protein
VLSWLNKKIASHQARKWFIVLSTSLVVLAGFESLAFLTGIFQLRYFLNISVAIYIYMIWSTTVTFDLKLKVPRAWEKSNYYYHHTKQWFVWRIAKMLWRALKMRFAYLSRWKNWRNFQYYLILPAILYWAVVVLIFLNPFRGPTKQIIALAGALLLAVEMWFLKFIFTNQTTTSRQVRSLMFSVMAITAFLVYSALLGLTWYLGLPDHFFIVTAWLLAFLLLYQSFFRESLASFPNLRLVFLGSVIAAVVAYLEIKYWTVNYYSAGLLLAAIIYLFWGLVSNYLHKRLSRQLAWQYLLVFLLAVMYALATTNFHSRIG